MFIQQKKHSQNHADVLLPKRGVIRHIKKLSHSKGNGFHNRSVLMLIHVPYSTTMDKKLPPQNFNICF